MLQEIKELFQAFTGEPCPTIIANRIKVDFEKEMWSYENFYKNVPDMVAPTVKKQVENFIDNSRRDNKKDLNDLRVLKLPWHERYIEQHKITDAKLKHFICAVHNSESGNPQQDLYRATIEEKYAGDPEAYLKYFMEVFGYSLEAKERIRQSKVRDYIIGWLSGITHDGERTLRTIRVTKEAIDKRLKSI